MLRRSWSERQAMGFRANGDGEDDVDEQPTTAADLVRMLVEVKDVAAAAQRRQEVDDYRTRAKAEVAAERAALDRDRGLHDKAVAEHEAKVKADHAALDARIGEIEAMDADTRARNSRAAQHETATAQARSQHEQALAKLRAAAASL
jgi:hypothetical protein